MTSCFVVPRSHALVHLAPAPRSDQRRQTCRTRDLARGAREHRTRSGSIVSVERPRDWAARPKSNSGGSACRRALKIEETSAPEPHCWLLVDWNQGFDGVHQGLEEGDRIVWGGRRRDRISFWSASVSRGSGWKCDAHHAGATGACHVGVRTTSIYNWQTKLLGYAAQTDSKPFFHWSRYVT
jgi:hypothetical protein